MFPTDLEVVGKVSFITPGITERELLLHVRATDDLEYTLRVGRNYPVTRLQKKK